MNTREAFEATISAPPFEADVSRHPDSGAEWPGCYKDYQVHLAWDLFQAGAAWAARECVKECEGAFVCCENRVVGAEYMGSQEMICCGEPLEMKSAEDVADAIRARFPEAWK